MIYFMGEMPSLEEFNLATGLPESISTEVFVTLCEIRGFFAVFVDSPRIHADCLDKFGDTHVLSKWWKDHLDTSIYHVPDNSAVPSLIVELVDREALECVGVYASRKVPMLPPDECDDYVVVNGSWLYGISKWNSDFDEHRISDDTYHDSNNRRLSRHIRHIPSGAIVDWSSHGSRYSLETIYAPEDCILNKGKHEYAIRTLRGFLDKSLNPIRVREASSRYFHHFYKYFYAPPLDISDKYIRQWILSSRWPYKLGYYMMVDCYLSLYALHHNKYDLRRPFEKSTVRDNVMRCSSGHMSFNEWKDIMIKIAPDDVVKEITNNVF